MTNKFARRFVIGGDVKTRMTDRYLHGKALRQRGTCCLATRRLINGDLQMRKTILTVLGSALLVASTVQFAAAAEHHKARKVYRAPAPASEQFRNSNAYDAPYAPSVQPDWSEYSRYQNGAMSAPAGR